MAKKKTAIWISPTPVTPVNSGNRKHVNYLVDCADSRGFEIDFVQYMNQPATDEQQELGGKRFRRFASFVRSEVGQSQPGFWGIDDWVLDEFLQYLKDFVRGWHYDLAVVEYVWLSRVLELFDDATVKVIDTHDIFTDRDLLLEKQGIAKQWFYTRCEHEVRGLSRADIVLGITKSDCDYFRSLLPMRREGNALVMHCGTGVKTRPRPAAKGHQRGNSLSIGYLASDNALNKLAAKAFFEAFASHAPVSNSYHFNIGGSIGRHIPKMEGIKTYTKGYVGDLASFYDDVDIIIAPMVEGTGLKIKCVEALEYGKPLAATLHATNDLPVSSLWHQFQSVELMSKYIAQWLERNQSARERNTTLEYLSSETARVLEKLKLDQRALENALWSEIQNQIRTREVQNPRNAADSALEIWKSQKGKEHAPVKHTTVSVIIAAYNTEQYIGRCLESLQQDHLENFEIIVVDDGSSDRTGEIARQYADKDDRIWVLHQKNAGQGAARNRGLEIATGEYVYFVDSDDAVGPDSLLRMYEQSKRDQLDICSPERPYLSARPIRYISALPGWCCFIRRDLLDGPGQVIRQPGIRSGQDGVFANMLLTRCQRAGVCVEAKYHYEKRDDSTFNLLKKDVSAVPSLVEEHLHALRVFYTREGLFDSQADRFLLFLQDETFKWRLLAHLPAYTREQAQRVFLAIKAELAAHFPQVPKESIQHFQQDFLSIAQQSFDDFCQTFKYFRCKIN